MIKDYYNSKKCKNILCSIACGKNYLNSWEISALPLWKKYCKRHGLGLLVVTDDIVSKKDKHWKKATWQKLLLGDYINKFFKNVENVCYLDSDILISPFAPNVFESFKPEKIAVVSQVKNLPKSLERTRKKLAFLRHHRWSNKYPLNSALFMSPNDIFKYHNLKQFDNYFCAGMFVFNIDNHRVLLRSFFDNYDRKVDSITGGGDEAHVNYEFQNWGNLQWLPYEYQSLWVYEAPNHYPFLFNPSINKNLIIDCIEASLYHNHFLHFAGSWNECEMWKVGNFFESKKSLEESIQFSKYLSQRISDKPVGLVKP
jgi:hypothetical protein